VLNVALLVTEFQSSARYSPRGIVLWFGCDLSFPKLMVFSSGILRWWDL
jgi:hypothetical protein